MEWEDDYFEPDDERSGERHDPKVEEAKETIKQFFSEQPKATPYLKQLQVKFEKKFFHWVSGFAVRELLDSGFLRADDVPIGSAGLRARFLFRPSHRDRKRQIRLASRLIAEYSAPEICDSCGHHAELLFELSLLRENFQLRGRNVSHYGELKWVESGHNLGLIVEKDGMVYGCEIKNRLEYIDRRELTTKLKMCRHLGIRPMFIMRHSPKTYNDMIIKDGGYVWIFETQIYAPGREQLVSRMQNGLGLPAVCTREIPRGMIDRFLKWHNKVAGM